MCLLLWTLPHNNHPRIKFAFASNRDECLDRPTSCAGFWDTPVRPIPDDTTTPRNDMIPSTTRHAGILCGVDRKPAKANLRHDRDLPGTWVGITTEGDLVALTDYLEPPSYYDRPKPTVPKPSRGQLCGDFLVNMAERDARKGHEAEKWIRAHATIWDSALEGLNLLVVQGAGDQQCVGANREGSELLVFDSKARTGAESTNLWIESTWKQLTTKWSNLIASIRPTSPRSKSLRIPHGTVTGLSNSVFGRPWRRVEIGIQALEVVLNRSLDRFGSGQRASIARLPGTAIGIDESNEKETGSPAHIDEDSQELVWLVIEMLTLLRVHTKPYPENVHSFELFTAGLQERVFVPRTGLEHLLLPHLRGEYGTRSSTVVLFGRNGRAVFVEKNWYAPRCPVSGERQQYDVASAEGVVWWQGEIGRPHSEWARIQGQELETLFESARHEIQCL